MLQSLRAACQAMWDVVRQYVGGFPAFPILSIAAMIYLLANAKDFRRRLLIPIIVLVVVVVNPVLYSLVYGNNNLPFVSAYGLRYWRFFWLLPQGILIAAAAMRLAGRLKKPLARCLGLVAAAALIMLAGQNLYATEKEFAPAESAYKLSPIVEHVCQMVLADDPEPLCMLDNSLSMQAREYSGSIRQLWGRNGTWSVFLDPEAWEVYNLLQAKPREWEPIFAFAEARGVTHIAFSTRKDEDRDEMLAVAGNHGYALLGTIEKKIVLHRQA